MNPVLWRLAPSLALAHARRRQGRLLERGDWSRAHSNAKQVVIRLNHERHYGSRRRREQLTLDLDNWRIGCAELARIAARSRP